MARTANDKQTSKTETGRNFQFNIRQGSANSVASRAKKVSGSGVWVLTWLNVTQRVYMPTTRTCCCCICCRLWQSDWLTPSSACHWGLSACIYNQTEIFTRYPNTHTLHMSLYIHMYVCKYVYEFVYKNVHLKAHNCLGSLWLLFLLMLPASSVNRLLKQVVVARFSKAFLLTFVACVAEVLRFVCFCAQ